MLPYLPCLSEGPFAKVTLLSVFYFQGLLLPLKPLMSCDVTHSSTKAYPVTLYWCYEMLSFFLAALTRRFGEQTKVSCV